MTWLALDTATDRATVAVGRDRETALEAHLDGARRHASAALPMLQRLLDERGMTLADLRGIVIADGPGSFTGLRVGAAIAKALAHSRGVPVFSAPSLMARALAASAGKVEPVVVTSNALRGDVYAAVYRFRPAAVETLVAPRVVAAGELDTIVPRNAIVSGDRPADARDLIGLAGMAGGAAPLGDVAGWEPVYGRPAEAQAVWERTHGRPLSSASGLAG